MKIDSRTKICLIIGDPVEHSLSPVMHNAGYKALEIEEQFVFLAATVPSGNIKNAVEAVRTLQIRGLTCTMPHKIKVMKYLDEVDSIAQKIGAVNTVVNEKGLLKGYNTDWLGTVIPLERFGGISGKKVALIGAGGAARAIAFGVVTRGASLTIFNRDLKKATVLATEIEDKSGHHRRVKYSPIKNLEAIKTYDIVINSTNLGMGEYSGETPVPAKYLHQNQVVFDAVYSPFETRFLREAKLKGARIIHGTEMLLHQGTAQFELYTGKKAPIEAMREALLFHISE